MGGSVRAVSASPLINLQRNAPPSLPPGGIYLRAHGGLLRESVSEHAYGGAGVRGAGEVTSVWRKRVRYNGRGPKA